MKIKEQDLRYLRAKDRVKKIRGFYSHVVIFCVVIALTLMAPLLDFNFCFFCFSKNKWVNLLGFAPWFLGICVHGFLAYGKIGLIKKWEEKKLKEFLEE